jgi:phenylacetate-coenzyme A ligase PaaK-like adenylate-forming protein
MNFTDHCAESVKQGWMHTGDLATMDAEGYINIVGRIKDMIIRGGENVYPREIEEFLFKHPAVQEAQVRVFGARMFVSIPEYLRVLPEHEEHVQLRFSSVLSAISTNAC